MRGTLAAIAIAAAGALLIGATRAEIVDTCERVKEKSDSYGLPPPEETVHLSLGYRSALADVLWAHVLVEQGLRTSEQRRFDNLTRLIDTVIALDPTFREPYRLADALITFQVGETSRAEIDKAREIMETGVKNRPLDAGLWLILGQFVAFIAPGGYLSDPDEKVRWRAEGAKILQRAAELSGDDANIAWQAISGAGVLQRAGERDAAINFLERTLRVTDDDELKAKIETQLNGLLGEQKTEALMRQERAFQDAWRADLPFVNRGLEVVLGPPRDLGLCAGDLHEDEPACATTWREWTARSRAAKPGAGPR